MEKAYDLKDLVEKLKAAGLDVAEDAALKLVDVVFDWGKESAELSENKIDDVLLAAFPVAKEWIHEQVDKIDGEQG